MARGTLRRGTAALAAVLTAALGLAACSSSGSGGAGGTSAPDPAPTVSAFVAAWSHHDWAAMAALVENPPADFASVNAGVLTDLGATSASYAAGTAQTASGGTRAKAPVTETYHLPVLGTWTVHGALSLVLLHGKWKVAWTPAAIDPALGKDGRFAVRYDWPARAAVLAADGTPISPSSPTSVIVGLEGQYVKDTATLTRDLVAAGAPASAVASAITAAHAAPTAFEPVFTVRWSRYEQLRPTLYPIPGVFFHAQGGSGSSAPAPLAAIVGTLGAISKTELRKLGPPYTADSVVGQSGIEQLDERQLAGTPGVTVTVVDPSGTTLHTLVNRPPKPGAPVRTTIDLAVEQDAASALASAPNLAALVAIDARSGRVLAAANTSQGEDLALEGEQPPGSTMKMITSTALIEKGLTPASAATCPPVVVVDGESLHNDSPDESASNLLSAFTVSCNTAFIGLTMANLDDHSLHAAAAQYGIGGTWNPGAPAFTGNVPVNTGQTDLAASAIGQSQVVMNPLDLAMVAADIDTGTVRQPWIAEGAPAEHAATSTLPANVVSDLHEMMLSVVQRGTASGTGLPAGTYAKTGTAEYGSGSGSNLLIDAWLAGFNGNVAFAMLVVDAPGDGGPTDGPIVAKFLNGLPAGL
jgi:hypothetical protein